MKRVWEGADELVPLLRPIGDVHENTRNPWHGDVEEIAKSLVRWGQVRPILVDEDGAIVAGNHTFKAAASLGWTHVAAVRNQFATPAEARDYLLADNRLAELGSYEHAELLALLEELETSGMWDGTGYQPDDVALLRELEKKAAEPAAPPRLAPTPRDEAGELREVVLMFDRAQRDQFSNDLKILRQEYGTTDVLSTVLASVHSEAVRVNQGPLDG